jgi:hypothetical protein
MFALPGKRLRSWGEHPNYAEFCLLAEAEGSGKIAM